MAFSFDFSQDKPDIRAPIPAGTIVMARMGYKAGGSGPQNALTKGKDKDGVKSDVEYLNVEFTVLRGPYKGRKVFTNMTFIGGKVDEKGVAIASSISRKNIRSIIDCSEGLATTDESAEANARRVLPDGFPSLIGRMVVFEAKLEAAQNGHPAKNGVGQILTIDHPRWPKSEDVFDAVPAAPAAPAPTITWGAAPSPAAAIGAPSPAAFAPPPGVVQAEPIAPGTSGLAGVPDAAVIAAAAAPAQGGLPGWMTS